VIRSGIYIVTNPDFLKTKTEGDVACMLQDLDNDYFFIPENIEKLKLADFKEYSKMNTYKVGFLYEYLRILLPSLNRSDVFGIIFNKYQVYLSKRVMEKYITLWNKNRHKFIVNVSN